MKKTLNRIVFSGLLLVTLGILAAIVIGMIQDQARRQARSDAANATRTAVYAENLQTYGDDLMGRCDNPDTNVAAAFPVFEQPPRLLVLETGTSNMHTWHTQQVVTPQNAAEVDLILCVPPNGVGERVEMEVCTYQDTQATVQRYRVNPQLIALLPTGETAAVTTIQGAAPDGCPFSISVGGQDLSSGERVVLGTLPNAIFGWQWINHQEKQAQLTETLGAEIMGLCQNPVPAAGETPQFSMPPKLLILDYGYATLHEWQLGLPQDWKGDEPTLVACVSRLADATFTEIQKCSFIVFGGAGRSVQGSKEVPLLMPSVKIALVDPATGITYGDYTLEGYNDNVMADCPQNLNNATPAGIMLKFPTVSLFQQWLASMVE